MTGVLTAAAARRGVPLGACPPSAPARSASARSWAWSISIALGDERRDDAHERFVDRVEREPPLALDHDDGDELPEHHRRHRHLALGVGQARQRDLEPRRFPAALLVRTPHRARVRQHLLQVADAHRLGTRRGHADDAVTDAHLRPDTLGRVAVAGDRVEALAVLVEQQEQRVLVPEQVGEAHERGAHQRVEVGAAGEAAAQLREPVRASTRRSPHRCRRR